VTPAAGSVAAVCFDLDDTLYPQAEWLDGAWWAVASRAAEVGVDPTRLHDALLAAAGARGTDGGGIIDAALEAVGRVDVPVAPLIAAFRAHAPETLTPFPGIAAALEELALRLPLGIVSDGDVAIQEAKLAALGLAPRFAALVWSDAYGREQRKPDPRPFWRAAALLGIDPARVVYVGDRPAKDVQGALGAGMQAIRVRTGEWRKCPDDARAWASVPTAVEAIARILDLLEDQPVSTPASTRNSTSPVTSR
jgi:putative hydrolase of the HAD superfamily